MEPSECRAPNVFAVSLFRVVYEFSAEEGLRQQMSGALRCPVCGEALGFGANELRRCSRFHCTWPETLGRSPWFTAKPITDF